MIRRLVVLSAVVITCGCAGGDTPVAPAATLSFAPDQWLSIVGLNAENDDVPPCPILFVRSGGTGMVTRVTMSLERGEWVARSAPDAGSLEMRFRETHASAVHIGVSGSVRGAAHDVAPPQLSLASRELQVIFAPGVSVEGTADRFHATGKMLGDIRFQDTDAEHVSKCGGVLWTMLPVAPVAGQ